jgi:hypothetical protein
LTIKLLKITLAVIGTIIVLFIVYIAKYQQIVNEGSKIYDEHCIKVNPLIIQRKNDYLNYMKLIVASAGASFIQDANNQYFSDGDKYIVEEKKWLQKMDTFLKRSYVKLITDKDVYQLSILYYKNYKNDYDSSLAVREVVKYENDPKKEEVFTNQVVTLAEESNQINKDYGALWEKVSKRFDLRSYFLTVPKSNCPLENYKIPDVNVEDIFNPPPVFWMNETRSSELFPTVLSITLRSFLFGYACLREIDIALKELERLSSWLDHALRSVGIP